MEQAPFVAGEHYSAADITTLVALDFAKALELTLLPQHADIVPMLERASLVGKSAFSAPQNRPRALDHYRSLALRPQLARPQRILLVDDFVTRGATLMGAASRISEGYPGIEVRGFAVVRSMTDGEVLQMREPCVGEIEMDAHGETHRRP